ncbi:TRAP transporter substrate-binding protein [Pseudogracilibacillus sp. SE30717A]|uniref:TRAP transporter substrate-binding protein n=1 Tax=Pseudogracilibacillus sp. SE30717A TaxID=3098293 RepID=UPI00300E076C
MNRSLLTLLALLFITSIALVGCGGGNEENSSSDADSSDSSESAESDNSGESVTWLANEVYPENNHNSEALFDFADKLAEVTDGKVTLDVMVGGALGYEGPELLTAVRDNAVPVSDMLVSGVAGDEPLFEIVTLPFLVLNFEEGKLLSEIARPYFDEVAEEKWNQKILYVTPWPAAGFWTKDKVESVDDMKGLKMRTYDKNGALVVEAGGGTPHPLPFSEVYSSLSTGVIDSVLTSTPTAVDAKFWEVLDYYSPVSVTMATNFVTVNLDEFNKLDAETQEAVIQAGKEMEEKVWEDVAALDKDQEAISNENGIETLVPSEEFLQELSELTEDIRQEWLETAPDAAKEIVEKFNQEVGR